MQRDPHIGQKKFPTFGFLRTNDNVADGLTKPEVQVPIRDVLRTGRHEINCKQRILRETALVHN